MSLNKSVLIVDDDETIQYLLCSLLESEGYKTLGAGHGQEALNHLSQGAQPHLILLDLMMPVMNGMEFLEAQQRDEKIKNIPVIVFSAGGLPPSLSNPVVTYLKKPIEITTLLENVKKYCL